MSDERVFNGKMPWPPPWGETSPPRMTLLLGALQSVEFCPAPDTHVVVYRYLDDRKIYVRQMKTKYPPMVGTRTGPFTLLELRCYLQGKGWLEGGPE
jgi:hypothetical protein